jgi:hypothetical protein
MDYVYHFYEGLMGSKGKSRVLALGQHLWDNNKVISYDDNLAMELTFTDEELQEVLLNMKPDSAPGSDDLLVLFLKRF